MIKPEYQKKTIRRIREWLYKHASWDEVKEIAFKYNVRVEDKEPEKEIKTPTCGEVISFFLKNGYSAERGKRAFSYYNRVAWKNVDGSPIVDWKASVSRNWEKQTD